MNNYILAGISFLAGAAVSGVAAWFTAKKRYERIHQEEMNKVWSDIQNTSKKEKKETPEQILQEFETSQANTSTASAILGLEKPDLTAYANRIREESYGTPKDVNDESYIYEIEYSDLDEDNYTRVDLMLYADGIVCDELDVPVKDVTLSLGTHYLDIMNGKDEAYIRNERKHIDYDICRSMLSYAEQLDRHPETEQRVAYNDALDEFYSDEEDEE